MIEVSGYAKLAVQYSVVLPLSEEQFDALPEREQNQLIEDNIDWHDVCRQAEVDEIEVHDLVEKEID